MGWGCLKDLCFVGLCLFVLSFTSGSIEYIIEYRTPETDYNSIPDGMWWALQTVVTLGTGDIVPVTTIGKIMGGAVAYFGMMILSVPLLFVGGKFMKLYKHTTHMANRPKIFGRANYKISGY